MSGRLPLPPPEPGAAGGGVSGEPRLAGVPWRALAGLAPALEAPLARVLAGAPAERVLDRFLRDRRGLGREGRAAAAEALFGVGLWRRRLRAQLGLSPLPPAPGKWTEGAPPLALLAALARDLGGEPDAERLCGLAPGTLPAPLPPPARLADRHSLPDWLAEEIRQATAGDRDGEREGAREPDRDLDLDLDPDRDFDRGGDLDHRGDGDLPEAHALAAALNAPGPIALRPNLLRTDALALGRRLAAEGLATRPGRLAPGALVALPSADGARPNLLGLPAFREGLLEVQDEGSQLLAAAVEARPGDAVLDACAGAGGKALALAAAVAPGGAVHAEDPDAERLARLRLRAARAGAGTLVRVHGAEAPAGLRFDRALVDAPCSELGALRRGPDLRWRLDPATFAALPALQLGILLRAADRLRPGGRLVYATCTFRRAEDEGVARALEAARPGLRRVRPAAAAPLLGADGFLRLLPHRHGTDGFFAAAWERGT